MSQAALNAPTVTSNAANTRQQVPLRDYLNARVAPFLKKAITESLGAEAEFPLQWLGECLIHQSILYEGNPDRTNIRERFLYKFDDPKPQEVVNAESETAPQASPQPTESREKSVPEQPEASTNETNETNDAAPAQASLRETHEYAMPQMMAIAHSTDVNGTKEEEGTTQEGRDVDTEMGGTA
ncbi:hypothetical protein H2200_001644 [Cladophialophora chaetospira]|uniref:Uncharacterized protein n=1 Tax=Cladophialophora chaetospira TaxID=386627 RepID=A0AA38XL97_9EURO|nr:hypothetical protein H2200_001644 [Cladophialophora chaetospira]